MGWLPQTIEQLRYFVKENGFVAGFCVALFFITMMRRYLFKSSEHVLQQMNNELNKECKRLENALKQEQKRVTACHREIEILKTQIAEK